MAKLSVVIPTYNRGALVTDAIDSALSQDTDSVVEVIVVDDGSTDDTRRLLEPYGSRIDYRYQPNGGMNAARNAGIEAATGEYVCLLDSDDVWLPFKAELQVRIMERVAGVGFAFSNFFVWRNEERIPDGTGRWMLPGRSIEQHTCSRISSRELGRCEGLDPFDVLICDIFELSLYQPVVLPSTTIVRREALEALGPLPEGNRLNEWEYFAAMSHRFGAAYIGLETTLNRSHEDSVRLTRADLAERAAQRLDSIARTYRADAEFMATHADEVARVESQEWTVLCKRACLDRNLAGAVESLDRIEGLLGYRPFKLRLLCALVRLPGSAAALDYLRRVRSV